MLSIEASISRDGVMFVLAMLGVCWSTYDKLIHTTEGETYPDRRVYGLELADRSIC